MTEPTSKTHRWFQFRIRTLLVLVAICAVVCWAIFDGYPRLQEHLRRSRFESLARQLKVGASVHDNREFLTTCTIDGSCSGLQFDDPQGHGIRIQRYDLRSVIYFVVDRYDKSFEPNLLGTGDERATRIEVFRVGQVPPNYRPCSPKVLANLKQAGKLVSEQDPSWCYEADITDYIAGDRKDDFGLEPDLIYSDSIKMSSP